MKYYIIILLLIIPSLLIGKDYYTVVIKKTNNPLEAENVTRKYKELGFDAFTQLRPEGGKTAYLSCVNKFNTVSEATAFARNLIDMKYFSSFHTTLVLSESEWTARFIKNKENRLPAKMEVIDLNPKKLPKREPAAIKNYEPKPYPGTPRQHILENPVISGQKFVSTENGLYVSVPTSKGDHWEKIPTQFDSQNAFLHFLKNGSLFVNEFKLTADQKAFIPAISKEKYSLGGYKVKKIFEKDGLLWMVFSRTSTEHSEEESLTLKSIMTRIFISADDGSDWSELPAIIQKDI